MCSRTHLSIVVSAISLIAVPGNLRAQFTGEFSDGTRFQNAQLVGWPDGKEAPRLKQSTSEDKERDLGALFDAKNSVTWLFNERAEPPSAPKAWVELFGGDRLPGRVLGYRYGTESPVDRQPAHLLVLIDPDAVQSPSSVVRVQAAAVRKVVWQPRHSGYVPSSLFLLDGRQIRFRALRWASDAVMLLLNEGGTRRIAFTDIAELHLPRRDPWRAYQETLATLSPDCTARLMRLETSRGLVLTGTMDRSRVSAAAHLLQPAWCLEPVGFEPRQMRWWRFFRPHEVPLSLIEPLRAEQRSPLEGVRGWQADQNVKLQPLRSGGKLYSSGLGMQSHSEVEFELPSGVQAFRALVGMDEFAGRHGCGRGLVHVNGIAEKPLWQSEVFVGTGEPADTGRLPLLGPAQGQKTLVLVADAPADRPADADPLNIRSFVDWLEPVVELDRDQLLGEVQRLLPETIPAWQGWAVSTSRGDYRVSPRWDVHHLPATRLVPDVTVQGGTVVLSRQVEVRPDLNYLCLSLGQEPGRPSGWVEVRVDGGPVAELIVPQWQQVYGKAWLSPIPSFVPLAKYHGKTVKLEVEYHPAGESGTVQWSGLEFVQSKDLGVWVPVEVIEARAAAPETTLVKEPGQTLFVPVPDQRKVPKSDTYTIVAETALTEISAIRLELLPDGRLPSNGPGRSWDGEVFLSEFKVTTAPRNKPDQARAVPLTAAGTDSAPGSPPSNTVDGNPKSGWIPAPGGRNVPPGQPPLTHVIVFTPAENIAFLGGARLTFTLETQAHGSPGRFRLLVTSAARPVPVARPGVVLERPGLKTLFEDERDFVNQLGGGDGKVELETKDKFSGGACIKLIGNSRDNPRFLGGIRIRREPGLGEFRYLQFAWKKSDGEAIGLQLAHDNQYGPTETTPASYRYHAGPGKPWGDSSIQVSDKLPAGWVLVTRDLFADFGEFTLTGLSLDARGGSHALYDRIRLARTRDALNDE